MRTVTNAAGPVLAAALLISLPAVAGAQMRAGFPSGDRISLRVRGGSALPAGEELKQITDAAGTVGAGVALHFHRTFALRGDVNVEWLDATSEGPGGTSFPGLTLYHLTGGIEANFWQDDEALRPLTSTVHVGGGVTRMEADRPLQRFEETYPTITMGASGGYQVTEYVNIFVEYQAFLMIADSDDTVIFRNRLPEELRADFQAFTDTWSNTVTLGTRLTVF